MQESSPCEAAPDSRAAAAAHLVPELVVGEQAANGLRHRGLVDVGNADAGVTEHFRRPAGAGERHDRHAAFHGLHVDQRARIFSRSEREQIGGHVVRSHGAARPDEPDPVFQTAHPRQSCSSQRRRFSSMKSPTQTNQVRGDAPAACLIEQDPARHVDEEICPFSQIDRPAAEHDPGVVGQPQLAPDAEPKRFAVETVGVQSWPL